MAKKNKTGLNIDSLIANESLVNSDIVNEIESGLLDYALKTIIDRAIPNVKDGLKPVQRRILYASWRNGYLPNKSFVKNAKIVGDTMGNYHPHGDGCGHPDTQVYLASGEIKTLGELYNEGKDQYVLCVDKDGNPKVSRAYAFRVGKITNEIYHLKLSNGKELKFTNNHPFMLKDLTWKRADELKVNDILYSAILNYDSNDEKYRPNVNMNYNNVNTRIAYLSGEYKFGEIPKGNIIHHINEKPFNNHPDNLMNLSKKEHDLLHKSYNKALDLGRERMFNGDLKEKTHIKNSYLMKEYNKNQGINKAIKVIRELQDKRLELTKDNYDLIKSNYYNYPEIDKMIKIGQIKSFDELIEITNNTYNFIEFNKEDVYENINVEKEIKIDHFKIENRSSENFYKKATFDILVYLLENNIEINRENYSLYREKVSKITNIKNYLTLSKLEEKFGFDNIIEEFKWQYPYIEDIEIEYLDEKIEMYDFSVDDYENMFIVTDMKDNRYSMVVTHNSIYGAETAMSQPWTFRYPLMDFQGNKGNLDGDGAAAMRYTEGKLNKTSMYMLDDTDKECVQFKSNYSETDIEPEVLPALLPNILLNGTSGIAVGYTTEIPSHNIKEVIDAIIATIKNKNITIDELMSFIVGPDLPGGGYLINNEKVRELYETGKSSLTYRAKHRIEENEENGNKQIVIFEIPPDVRKPSLVEKIYSLCFEKKTIARVNDVRDESEGDGVRIVIELHKTAIPDIVIKELYEKTQLQKNVSYIMRCIVNQTPKILNLKQLIECYIEHRQDVILNRSNFLLDKAMQKINIQTGYRLILNNMDKAIKIIRDSEDTKDASINLKDEFSLNDEQVSKILELPLRSLTKLNRSDIDNAIKELEETRDLYKNITSSQEEINKVIVSELKKLKKEFGDDRRTELIGIDSEDDCIDVKFKSNEPVAVVLTNKGNIKHLSIEAIEKMEKNKLLKERSEFFIQYIKTTMDKDFIIIFENGNFVKTSFNDITLNLNNESKIIKIVEYNEDKYIYIMTQLGLGKKIKMNTFKSKGLKVTQFMEIEDKDKIISIQIDDNNSDNIITVLTSDGLLHRFYDKGLKESNLKNKSMNCIGLSDNTVVDFKVSKEAEDNINTLVIYSKHQEGFSVKSSLLEEFKPKGRMSKGVKCIDYYKKSIGEVYKFSILKNDSFIIDDKGYIIDIKKEDLNITPKVYKPEAINYSVYIEKI